jgi:hypothetical protein
MKMPGDYDDTELDLLSRVVLRLELIGVENVQTSPRAGRVSDQAQQVDSDEIGKWLMWSEGLSLSQLLLRLLLRLLPPSRWLSVAKSTNMKVQNSALRSQAPPKAHPLPL